MIAKIKNYIQNKQDSKAAEQERASFVSAIRRKQREYNGAVIAYNTIMAESKDSSLHEIAYDHMKVKEREIGFMLAEARKSNIRAYWADMKIS